MVPKLFETDLAALKEKLLLMASHAEAAVNRAIRALLKRGDELARQYYFQDVIGRQTITFPVEFVKEKDTWKILEF
jgi:hypothetical protein